MSVPGIIQKTTRFPMRILAMIFFSVKTERVKKHGNFPKRFIIAANHCGRIDPWLIGYFMPRDFFYRSGCLRFMAYKKYMDMFFVGRFIKMWGAYSIQNRTGKPLEEVLSESLEILENGSNLLIFPEGKIINGGERSPARPGVAYLAEKSGLPIFPVFIKRNRRHFFFSRYFLVFGDFFYYKDIADKKGDLCKSAENIMERINGLNRIIIDDSCNLQ